MFAIYSNTSKPDYVEFILENAKFTKVVRKRSYFKIVNATQLMNINLNICSRPDILSGIASRRLCVFGLLGAPVGRLCSTLEEVKYTGGYLVHRRDSIQYP